MENRYWLSDEDFNTIYNKVPRLNIDLIIRKEDGIILIQRLIDPCSGYWHLPGGTVYKGEAIQDASVRIAKNETGVNINFIKCLGCVEFLSEKRDPITMHTICLVVEVAFVDGDLRHDKNAKDIKLVTSLDEVGPIINEHLQFLKNNS